MAVRHPLDGWATGDIFGTGVASARLALQQSRQCQVRGGREGKCDEFLGPAWIRTIKGGAIETCSCIDAAGSGGEWAVPHPSLGERSSSFQAGGHRFSATSPTNYSLATGLYSLAIWGLASP